MVNIESENIFLASFTNFKSKLHKRTVFYRAYKLIETAMGV